MSKNKNEIVKYNNDMNSVTFGNFKEKELDLFFSICFKIKEQGLKEIELSYDDLKSLSEYTSRDLKRLTKDLENVYDKMLQLNITIRYSELSFSKFSLFSGYTVSAEKRTVVISVSDKFEYILNKLIGNYTQFELMEFISLKSTYSKNMFKLLKQWENTKEIEFKIEEFRNMLAIPTNYRISEIDKRVLAPIMKELPAYFHNLKLTKSKSGQKVTSLKFTWNSKSDTVELEEKPNQIIISQKLYDLIKAIQSLTFFQNVMTPHNIEKLIKKYDEKTLIQILKRAKAHTYQQIKSIKYFDSVYESIKADPIIIIKPTEKIDNKEKQNSSPVEKIEKIDITREEFNKKYKEHLAEIGFKDNLFLKKGFEEKYNIVELEEKSIQDIKVFTEKDIPEHELLGKNGKKLVGAALQMRINKILKKNDLV